MFTKEQLEAVKSVIGETFNEAMGEKLGEVVGPMVAAQCKAYVQQMQLDRQVYGKDVTGLTEKQKLDLVELAKAVGFDNKAYVSKENSAFQASNKANEALIEEIDVRGGYLVSKEVADAILRIAASVGTIMNQAQKWTMKTDELGIPNYTGSFLTGAYLNVDAAGPVTGLTFGQAALIAKKWQLAFVIGNDLLADSSINLADWLLTLAGEALANMIDQQGFVGIGAPFVGILNEPGTTAYIMASGRTKFSNSAYNVTDGFDVLVDSSNMIGSLEESILDGASFFCHRTVWAAWRVQKDSSGNFILPFGGLPVVAGGSEVLSQIPMGGPIKPAGMILGYPLYTNRWLPALPLNNAASVSTSFAIFGNLKAMAFGSKGDMSITQFDSGAFGGKEIALADQKGIVYKNRHGLVIVLPAAFVVATTAAS